MSMTEQHSILIEPVISYPCEAKVGKTYLMTIDLRLVTSSEAWPYEDEEFPVWFLLDTMPLFSYEPLSESESLVVLHRFGGTDGPARFLLTAAQEATSGTIHVTLINRWGSPIAHVPLESEVKLVDGPRRFVVQRDKTSGTDLTLARLADGQIAVICDGQPSHTFDLNTLIPDNDKVPQPLDDPVAYGKAVYAALFPPGTSAQRALESMPERLLLVTTDNDLDAVPWEYAYGPDDFLVLECHFVRGLPVDQRMAPPKLESGPHIVAVPSHPLSHKLDPLDIDGEWMRLKEIIQELPYAITLERTRPPTLERTRHLVANQKHRIPTGCATSCTSQAKWL